MHLENYASYKKLFPDRAVLEHSLNSNAHKNTLALPDSTYVHGKSTTSRLGMTRNGDVFRGQTASSNSSSDGVPPNRVDEPSAEQLTYALAFYLATLTEIRLLLGFCIDCSHPAKLLALIKCIRNKIHIRLIHSQRQRHPAEAEIILLALRGILYYLRH